MRPPGPVDRGGQAYLRLIGNRQAAPPFVQASMQDVPAQTSIGVCGDAARTLLPDGIE